MVRKLNLGRVLVYLQKSVKVISMILCFMFHEEEQSKRNRIVRVYTNKCKNYLEEAGKRLQSLAGQKVRGEISFVKQTNNESLEKQIVRDVETIMEVTDSRSPYFMPSKFQTIGMGYGGYTFKNNIITIITAILISYPLTQLILLSSPPESNSAISTMVSITPIISIILSFFKGTFFANKALDIFAKDSLFTQEAFEAKILPSLKNAYHWLEVCYKKENPYVINGLRDRQFTKINANSKYEVKPLSDNPIGDIWRDFLKEILKLSDNKILVPEYIKENNSEEIHLFNIRGVDENDLKKASSKIESYTRLYIQDIIANYRSIGDVAIVLSRYKRSEDEHSVAENILASNQSSSLQQAAFVNPLNSEWKKLITFNFSRNADRYETPQVLDTGEGTELHIMKIKGITSEMYQKIESSIESELCKRVYFIHFDYQGIGNTGIELVNRELPSMINYRDCPNPKDGQILLGRDIKGFIYWDYINQPHASIVGITRSGKSRNVQNIIRQIQEKGYMMCFADFKDGVEFNHYRTKGYSMIDDPIEFPAFSTALTKEMTARSILFKNHHVTTLHEYERKVTDHPNMHKLPRVFVFVDEVATVMKHSDKEVSKVSSDNIGELLRKGGAFGIHVILITQSPDAESVGGATNRRNLGLIMSSRQDSRGSEMIFKDDRAFRKIPSTNYMGMFIALGATSEYVFKTPYMDSNEFKQIVLNHWTNPYIGYQLGKVYEVKEELKMSINEEVIWTPKF
ncbi:hypothetical protein EHS13_25135 [Paenibacillus psychroresistens]|uniref:FtsK domain-containing protein n=1 Tax=Paenibacillus psychroresistens TaxID=1778678 RepID=A0A6B8RRP4_9BACL|nr:FtsK/SpoIIIE domain-containing protein [Paenibacillus psychroresistens]QGQ97938.1 hypothetical protein EHS13_25135 [Paenibacillus psychroresistens]